MTQKRNSHSSVVSVEEESMDLLDFDAEKDDDSVDYIETVYNQVLLNSV